MGSCDANRRLQFQSTPPTRGATIDTVNVVDSAQCFNPRPPHGERPDADRYLRLGASFNPRPPHGERLIQMIYT